MWISGKSKRFLPTGRQASTAADAQVGYPGPARIQIQYNEGAASIGLADGNGKDRIVLKVDADNNAEIRMLDESGKTIFKIPE